MNKNKSTTRLVLKELQDFLSKSNYSNVFVLTDENTHRYCYPMISDVLGNHKVITIKSGEEFKTIETCCYIWEKLSGSGADRNSLLINLGGGVICDMGGFSASVYMRGIDFIHIPTSLLAMCDSCIGGKTAVDMNHIKNIIGSFTDAEAVFVYPKFTDTLPERHVLSGFAEMIKHAIIADQKLFSEFEEMNCLPVNFEDYIFSSLTIKQHFVSRDPYEKNLRKALNFGHTIGHAIESYFLENFPENYLFHGEAIALGMLTESHIAYTQKMIDKSQMNRIADFILKYFKSPILTSKNEIEIIAKKCLNDKKNIGGKIMFSLPDKIGNVKVNIPVPLSNIIKSLTKVLPVSGC